MGERNGVRWEKCVRKRKEKECRGSRRLQGGKGVEGAERGREGMVVSEEGKRVIRVAFWNVPGLENKNVDFWKKIARWDVVVEMWIEKKGWEQIKHRLPRGYRWSMQLARKKNEKGKAMRRRLMGVKKELEVIEL